MYGNGRAEGGVMCSYTPYVDSEMKETFDVDYRRERYSLTISQLNEALKQGRQAVSPPSCSCMSPLGAPCLHDRGHAQMIANHALQRQ